MVMYSMLACSMVYGLVQYAWIHYGLWTHDYQLKEGSKVRRISASVLQRLRVMVAHMNARGTFILSEKDAEKKDPEDLKYRQELMVSTPVHPHKSPYFPPYLHVLFHVLFKAPITLPQAPMHSLEPLKSWHPRWG